MLVKRKAQRMSNEADFSFFFVFSLSDAGGCIGSFTYTIWVTERGVAWITVVTKRVFCFIRSVAYGGGLEGVFCLLWTAGPFYVQGSWALMMTTSVCLELMFVF